MTRRTATQRLVRPAGRVLSAAAIGFVAVSSMVLPASAEDDITFNPDKVLIAEPGSLQNVAVEAIPAELQGQTCDLRVVAENGSSVHPGNTVIITTGTSRMETAGVEDAPDGQVIAVQPVTLGETLTVQLLMGPEGLSSLGFTVGVDCQEPPPVAPVTETPAETTETTTEPTVLPSKQIAPPVQAAPPAQA
ncbi:MAG: hypothetical protein GY773_23150, partial [Actinomycetia bacterium]|nr:hypothetical protein [Actinomycetes bacterium]